MILVIDDGRIVEQGATTSCWPPTASTPSSTAPSSNRPRRPSARLLGSVLLMTDPIRSNDHAGFLAKEYLLDYIRTGGGAVKFSVGPPGALEKFAGRLHAEALNNNYLYAEIDAAHTKISMTDQILFALTRSLDLSDLTRSIAADAYRAADFPVAELADVADVVDVKVQTVAAHHHVDPGELHRSVRRRLEHSVLDDRRLPRDLRLAVFRLAQHHLDAGDVADTEADAIGYWLTGQPTPIGPLRTSGIRYRITRANAHRVLMAMSSVIAAAGYRGLIVNLRIDELGRDRTNRTEGAVSYTKAARLDAYEVLRQIIDTTDALRHCLIVVTSPTELFDDPLRGPSAYQALAMRIIDDVEDRRHANPFATVVRVA
jgi:hypothetical protein